MAIHLVLNPPELNPRLKLHPEPGTGLDQHFTAATLWKEIGNGRLRVQNHSAHPSSQAIQPNSSNPRQR